VESNVRLPASVSAEPGNLKLRRTPYIAALLKLAVTAGVEEIVVVAGTQVAKTTWEEAALCYWAAVEPGPVLVVKPTEDACKAYIKRRIRPIFSASPAIARLMSDDKSDNTLDEIRLRTMPIYFGWAGSPQALASWPCRRVIADEVDKYPDFSGNESDPISLARERMATYGYRRCLLACSTPTTRERGIWKLFEACEQQVWYFVPCPHCGEYQRLVWSQVKYPHSEAGEGKIKHAERVEHGTLAYYECATCKGHIVDHHKPKMLEGGDWRQEDGQPLRESKRVGAQLPSLYSPWRTLSEMAAEWIKADGDPALTMNFRNSRLAEPFEVLTAKPKADVIRTKAAKGHPRFVVPDWAQVIIATADSQKDHYRYGVRAWGYSNRSRLIDNGLAASSDDLKQRTVNRMFGAYGCPLLLVDSGGGRKDTASGDITARVYTLARSDPTRIRAIKGASEQAELIRESFLKDQQLALWLLNVDRLKDQLFALINAADETLWEVFSECGEDYAKEMAGEHKVFDRKAKRELWTKVTSGAPNHAWDWEVYQVAAAMKLGLGMVPPQAAVVTPQPQQQTANPLNYRGRW
jgi:phage terminase large subunit GpA-like protein